MKKNFLISALLFSGLFYAQTCENIKSENTKLKVEIQTVKTENAYLKKVLEISTPILESEKDNNNFRITKVTGNKADKTISITFIVEAKDENKNMTITDISIIDIEGNEHKEDQIKSSKPYPQLATNVPLKLIFLFKEIQGEPLFIKLFRFKTLYLSEKSTGFGTKSNYEFRDLKVNWN